MVQEAALLLTPKNSVTSIKSIIGIVCVVFATIGAIIAWAAENRYYNSSLSGNGYPETILFLVAVLNLVGYICNIPAIFTWTAALFWTVAPTLFAFADSQRSTISDLTPFNSTGSQRSELRADMAGLVFLFFGSIGSFFCAPMQAVEFNLGMDVIVLIVVAVFEIIGGALIGNCGWIAQHYGLDTASGYITDASALFIVLSFFGYAILMQSKALINASLILSAIMWCKFLPMAYVPTANASFPPVFGAPEVATGSPKESAGYVLAWIGLTITSLFCVFLLATKYAEDIPDAPPADAPAKTPEENL